MSGVFVDAVEETRSHTSEEQTHVDTQARLREIVDAPYRTSTSTKASASQEYDLANELIDMRFLKKLKVKKAKNGSKGAKKAKIKGVQVLSPTAVRPLTTPTRVQVISGSPKGVRTPTNKANVRD